ncbi:MAG: hypothetical protein DRI61_09030 [Chloroflexi bacterium]|nr:MAG: hypothetical protein DRI61_09030 [Chloroflexota bacterium]
MELPFAAVQENTFKRLFNLPRAKGAHQNKMGMAIFQHPPEPGICFGESFVIEYLVGACDRKRFAGWRLLPLPSKILRFSPFQWVEPLFLCDHN